LSLRNKKASPCFLRREGGGERQEQHKGGREKSSGLRRTAWDERLELGEQQNPATTSKGVRSSQKPQNSPRSSPGGKSNPRTQNHAQFSEKKRHSGCPPRKTSSVVGTAPFGNREQRGRREGTGTDVKKKGYAPKRGRKPSLEKKGGLKRGSQTTDQGVTSTVCDVGRRSASGGK